MCWISDVQAWGNICCPAIAMAARAVGAVMGRLAIRSSSRKSPSRDRLSPALARGAEEAARLPDPMLPELRASASCGSCC